MQGRGPVCQEGVRYRAVRQNQLKWCGFGRRGVCGGLPNGSRRYEPLSRAGLCFHPPAQHTARTRQSCRRKTSHLPPLRHRAFSPRCCLSPTANRQGFWRSWHASYNRWLVRYMYVPLGGAAWRAANVWLIFSFVALWHDLEWRLLGWAWIMAAAMAPELVGGEWGVGGKRRAGGGEGVGETAELVWGVGWGVIAELVGDSGGGQGVGAEPVGVGGVEQQGKGSLPSGMGTALCGLWRRPWRQSWVGNRRAAELVEIGGRGA